jgi:hypothetical protein
MKISLVVLTAGKMMGKEIPITAAEFRIGKDPSCQLKPAAGVSDKHCAFLVKQGKLFLIDLGSAEGTFVNDNKISAEVELKPKDKVKVGPLLFEVKIEAAAPAAKPAVAAPAAAKPAVAAPAAKPAVVAPAAKPVEKVEPKNHRVMMMIWMICCLMMMIKHLVVRSHRGKMRYPKRVRKKMQVDREQLRRVGLSLKKNQSLQQILLMQRQHYLQNSGQKSSIWQKKSWKQYFPSRLFCLLLKSF